MPISSQNSLLITEPNIPQLAYAMQVILNNFGDNVSIVTKSKFLIKFGKSSQVGTVNTTIMTLPSGVLNETYISDNLITTISSSNVNDVEPIVIEGHTIDGNNDFIFSTQTATLDGQNKVTLTTPLARCTRMYANGSNNLIGDIYAYQEDTITSGVPDTGSKVHCIIPSGVNNSLKASTTTSKNDYWIVTQFGATILEKNASFAEVALEIRQKGKTFRQSNIIGTSSGQQVVQYFDPYLIVPSNADVRLVAKGGGANIEVAGFIEGYLAIVI